MKHIVKRKGHKEKFDERKIYASCYAACLSSNLKPIESEVICNKVCKDIKSWVKDKKEITSNKIFKEVIKSIKKHNKDVAFMYETHRDIA